MGLGNPAPLEFPGLGAKPWLEEWSKPNSRCLWLGRLRGFAQWGQKVIPNFDFGDVPCIGCVGGGMVVNHGPQTLHMMTEVEVVTSVPDRIREAKVKSPLAMEGQSA